MRWKELRRKYSDRLSELATMPPHQVLGVSVDANSAEIRASYIELVKAYHPDQLSNNCRSIGNNLGIVITAFLSNGSSDSRSFRVSFLINDHTGIILAIYKSTIKSSPRFSLSNDNSLEEFLSHFGFSFSDRYQEHISNTSRWESI